MLRADFAEWADAHIAALDADTPGTLERTDAPRPPDPALAAPHHTRGRVRLTAAVAESTTIGGVRLRSRNRFCNRAVGTIDHDETEDP